MAEVEQQQHAGVEIESNSDEDSGKAVILTLCKSDVELACFERPFQVFCRRSMYTTAHEEQRRYVATRTMQ